MDAALRSSSLLRHRRLTHHRRLLSTTATSLTTAEVKTRFRSEINPDKTLEIYNNLPHTDMSPIASRFALEYTIKCLSKYGRLADVETLIESQKKNPKITNEGYFSTLIRSYGMGGMADKAHRLFDQMEELGTPRTAISFNALLYVYNMRRKYDEVHKLFDEIPKKYGFEPDMISYGILIKSLCELKLIESVYEILEEMGKKNVEVTTFSYTTVLDALYKTGKVDEAEKIWKEMVEKGCSPDVAAYNVRIKRAHKGKPVDVLALIEEMTSAGLKADTISYNYLSTCYFKNDMVEDALKVYQDLEKNGCVCNAATYQFFIEHLCKKGNFEKAYEIFKESAKNNKVPSFPTLKILVKRLAENSKRSEAKEMIAAAKEKLPSRLLNAWKEFEVELGLSTDEASPTQAGTAVSV